jgi:PhzF family phenazine biosynthesis protein
MKVQFKQVDVFTDRRFFGNPVAVVLDAASLDQEQMQQFASWTNLSETTFVLPPSEEGADYRVRIFTPRAELPFAGHPTIGTAHAVLEAGIVKPTNGRLVQQCTAGLIEVAISDDGGENRMIAFELPNPEFRSLNPAETDELERVLGGPIVSGFPAVIVDVGPKWVVAQFESAGAVLALKPDLSRMVTFCERSGSDGVTVFGPHTNDGPASVEVRSFAPALGVNEDPVCGSGNGSVGAYIRESEQIDRFGGRLVSSQGSCVGRDGRVHIEIETNRPIRIGGRAITCVDGCVYI